MCFELAVQKERFCGSLHSFIRMLCVFMKSACVFNANFKILTGRCPYVYLYQNKKICIYIKITLSSMTHFGDSLPQRMP